MAINSREDLKEYCLRQLGSPVIQINVEDTQLEDRIDDALEFFRLYHYDGSETVYLKHQLTQLDIDNKTIPVSDLIYSVKRMVPFPMSGSSSNLFSAQYQILLNDIYNLSAMSLQQYVQTMQQIDMVNFILNGETPLRFNRYKGVLQIDADWSKFSVGDYIVVEAYGAVDEEVYTKIYSDPWLRKYTTALFKRQWAYNLKKFSGIALPGGVVLNGDKLYEEATSEITVMEENLKNNSTPLGFTMG